MVVLRLWDPLLRAGRWLLPRLAFAASLWLATFLAERLGDHYSAFRPNLFSHWWIIGNLRYFGFCVLLASCGRWLRGIGLALCGLAIAAEAGHAGYFGTLLEPVNFLEAFTDGGEIITVLKDEPALLQGPVLGLLLFSGLMAVGWHFLDSGLTRSRWAPVLLIGLLLVDGGRYHRLLSWHKYRSFNQSYSLAHMPVSGLPAPVNVYRAAKVFTVALLPRLVGEGVSREPILPRPSVRLAAPNADVILIVGESLTAGHVGLLGYKANPTTPELARLDGLFAAPVIAGATMTGTSVPMLLSRMRHPLAIGQIGGMGNNLFALAKQNGFVTHFYSAQSYGQITLLETALPRRFIDHFAAWPHGGGPDDSLLEWLMQVDFDRLNFIVLHQRGSHAPYAERYPPEYARFASEYDNSVLYTDHILARIMAVAAEHSKRPLYVFFTSDHGELLGERGLHGHGHFEPEVWSVPFLFWQRGGEDLRAEAQAARCHFDVATLVAHALGYAVDVETASERRIFVNGQAPDGAAGFIELDMRDGRIVAKKDGG